MIFFSSFLPTLFSIIPFSPYYIYLLAFSTLNNGLIIYTPFVIFFFESSSPPCLLSPYPQPFLPLQLNNGTNSTYEPLMLLTTVPWWCSARIPYQWKTSTGRHSKVCTVSISIRACVDYIYCYEKDEACCSPTYIPSPQPHHK